MRTQDTDFSSDTDADLLLMISWRQEDDEGARIAWGEFYQRHFEFLSAACLGAFGRRLGLERVEDLVNETFLRVFTHGADTFKTDESDRERIRKLVRAWLVGIARNLFLMDLRGRKKLPEVAFEESQHSQPELTPLSAERLAQCEQVRSVLESLQEREFDVLTARFSNYHRSSGKQQFDPDVLQDLTERWQVTKDNVRQILSRTMRKIREHLP